MRLWFRKKLCLHGEDKNSCPYCIPVLWCVGRIPVTTYRWKDDV